MAHESKSKHKEIYLGEQKNVGVNSMEIAALNKTEPVGKGLEVLHGTKEWQPDKKGNRRTKQTNLETETGEGAEQMKLVGRQRKPQRKTKQNRWRRPGTIARNKRKSIEDMRHRSSKQNKAGGEGLELLRETNGSQSKT